jgi:hypothetical protein
MAAAALAIIGPRANRPEVIRGLEEATQAEDPKLRSVAKEALQVVRR